jgi:Ca2+-binding RTX toxin-like protein
MMYGGVQGDTLLGHGGSDVLLGDNGKDLLNGGGGHDTFKGGFGADRLHGGRGRDVIDARDGEGDVVRGGPNADTCFVDQDDAVTGCEVVR